MKTLLIACLVSALALFTAPPAAAAPGGNAGGNSEWAKKCQKDYAALGFRNTGQCVSHYARGGSVVSGPATLTLTFEVTACATNPAQQCVWSVAGSGLLPGSEVIVGDSTVSYGASVVVDSAGNASMPGIYQFGSCVLPGYEHVTFIARGVAADGTPFSSAVVPGDYTQYVPYCQT